MPYKTGDYVHIHPDHVASYPSRANVNGTTYKVVSKGPKNYKLQPLEGVGGGLLAPEFVLSPGRAERSANVQVIPLETFHDAGTVVRFKDGSQGDGLFVVCGYAGRGHRVFPLGGSKRYFAGVNGNRLEALTIEHADATAVRFAPKES